MSNNKITLIDVNVFKDLDNLKEIDLFNNPVHEINGERLKGVHIDESYRTLIFDINRSLNIIDTHRRLKEISDVQRAEREKRPKPPGLEKLLQKK